MPLRKIAEPTDIAQAMAFLASHKAAGHISGQCLSIDGGMEGRLLWRQEGAAPANRIELPIQQPTKTPVTADFPMSPLSSDLSPFPLPPSHGTPIRVLITVNVDALDDSAQMTDYLGTRASPRQRFVKRVGLPRLVSIFRKHGILHKTTWFVPGSAILSESAIEPVISSGAEVGIMGYGDTGEPRLRSLDHKGRRRQLLGESLASIRHRLGGHGPLGFRTRATLTEMMADYLSQWGFIYGLLIASFPLSFNSLLSISKPPNLFY